MDMSHKTSRVFLIILVICHLVLASVYAFQTPYRKAGLLLSQRQADGSYAPAQDIGAPDERQHANYIEFLKRDHRLPVFNPKSPRLYEEYQSHQPPLFYGLAAVVSVGQDVESQSFGMTVRLLNAVIGSVGVVGAFFAALWGFRSKEVAVLSAAIFALLPMNVALSGAISNDPLLIAFSTWSFAFCLRVWNSDFDKGQQVDAGTEGGAFQVKWLILAGVLAALACLTKSSGLIALVSVAVVSVTAVRKDRELRSFKMVVILLLPLLMVSPLWLRNQFIYGDPLAQKAFKEAFTGSAQKAQIVQAIEASNAAGSPEVQYWVNWVGYWTARSFVGVFGYMDIWLNESTKPNSKDDPNTLYKGIICLHFLTLGAGLLIARKLSAHTRTVMASVGLCALAILVFVGFNNTYFQAQARYLFPALAGFTGLMAYGWYQLVGKRWQVAVAVVLLVYGYLNWVALSQLGAEFAKRILS